LVRHEISGPRGLAITEEHDIVFRDHPQLGDPAQPPRLAPANPGFSKTIQPDDVLLFRYSALTFNGHRIHYDRRYVTEVEHYPGLIVHGPLLATLLLDLLRNSLPTAIVKRFDFRAVSPLYDVAPFTVNGLVEGSTVMLWAADADGGLAMEATATLG
jgi:3-methylfumaryl-CoA hydratase